MNACIGAWQSICLYGRLNNSEYFSLKIYEFIESYTRNNLLRFL